MIPLVKPNVSYRDYTLNLGAGQSIDIGVVGDYWQVIQAASAIKMQFDNGSNITRGQGTGGPQDYTRVTITSTVAQTVIVSLGQTNGSTPYDARATLVGATINVSTPVADDVESPPDVDIPATASANVIGANATRRAVIIKNPSNSAGAVRVGKPGSVGATQGVMLEPGESLNLEVTAALDAYNPNAADVKLSLIELRLV